MEERILKLLSMVFEAKQKGHDITFHYSSHSCSITIAAYENGYQYNPLSEEYPDMSFYNRFNANESCEYDIVFAYLKGLINE